MYSIYTSADGEIKAPIINPQRRMCVFVPYKPYLFLALVYLALLCWWVLSHSRFIALIVDFLSLITIVQFLR